MSENRKRAQKNDGRSYEKRRSEYKKNSRTAESAIIDGKYSKESAGIAKVSGKQSREIADFKKVSGKHGYGTSAAKKTDKYGEESKIPEKDYAKNTKTKRSSMKLAETDRESARITGNRQKSDFTNMPERKNKYEKPASSKYGESHEKIKKQGLSGKTQKPEYTEKATNTKKATNTEKATNTKKATYLQDDFENYEDFDIEYYKNKQKTGKGRNQNDKENSRVGKEGYRTIRESNRQDKRGNNKSDFQFNQQRDGKPSLEPKKSDRHSSDSNRNLDKKGSSTTQGRTGKPKSACPYLKECGGCNILQQNYADELKEKQKSVEKLLGKYCKVEPIIGMKEPKHYRNKVHVVFDHDKKGNPISGVYEERTHRVIAVENCLIHDQKADAIIATIRGMLKSFKIRTYDEDTGYGLIRHVLIRTGYASGEIMVVLVLASPIMPSKSNFVKALRQKHPEITTIVINVNDKSTSMVLGEKEQIIYGKGYIEDSLCGKVFRISPKSFYQVNPAQTEVLYKKAIEMAGLTGTETVIDAYCGTGTIGIIASDHAKRVIGVELNKDAVHDANINAKRNDARNIEFYNNDAGVFMSQMATQKESADVVFMDPPRTGSSEQFMDSVAILKPKKVVYVSCNPVTLERDLQYLTKKGYKAEKAVPVDMFPWTGHVETCCLLYKTINTLKLLDFES